MLAPFQHWCPAWNAKQFNKKPQITKNKHPCLGVFGVFVSSHVFFLQDPRRNTAPFASTSWWCSTAARLVKLRSSQLAFSHTLKRSKYLQVLSAVSAPLCYDFCREEFGIAVLQSFSSTLPCSPCVHTRIKAGEQKKGLEKIVKESDFGYRELGRFCTLAINDFKFSDRQSLWISSMMT